MHLCNKKGLLRALMPLLALALAGGCAQQPPGGSGVGALSGIQMQVTLEFAAPINPNYYYYFLINNPLKGNSPTGPGPIPVGPPIPNTTYGNGFATSSNADDTTGGFTDFVLYGNYQYPVGQTYNGFALYHIQGGVNGANNPQNFQGNGVPIITYAPNQIDSTGDQLEFTIDLAQLYPSRDGYTQSEAVTKARSLQCLQVNVVATNSVTTDPTNSLPKEFDSFGNDIDGRGSFLIIDPQDLATYFNGSANAGMATKPSDSDIYVYPSGSIPSPDPALQLVKWQIQVVNTNNN